jgi:RsiW-degrading membrane proteinase PrsW (M82 family)
MFCQKCGTQGLANASFCAKCGNPLRDAADAAQPDGGSAQTQDTAPIPVATYRIVLEGTCLAGFDPVKVQADLGGMIRQGEATAARLLAGQETTIKGGADQASALGYVNTLRAIGAACRLEAEAPVSEIMAETGRWPSMPSPAPDPTHNAREAGRQPVDYIASIQNVSDKITGQLGLEKIEGFSLSTFFSEAFRKHDPDEVEHLLSVGTQATTPPLAAAMSVMPNPWIFFRVLSGTVITYLIFLFAWHKFNNPNLIPGLIIMGSFAVPFSVLILFFELNTPKNISIVKLVQLVVAGGALSLLLTLVLFEATPFLGIFGASAAGFIEEAGKLAALLFAMRTVSGDRYKYRLNALLLGAAVGTGFAAFESAGYALRYGMELGSRAMLDVIEIRGALSPFAHIAWSAIAASAFWVSRPYHNDAWGTVTSSRFLKIFAIPVVLHFIWNLPFEGPFMIKNILLGFVAWVVIISFVQSGLKEISAMTAQPAE